MRPKVHLQVQSFLRCFSLKFGPDIRDSLYWQSSDIVAIIWCVHNYSTESALVSWWPIVTKWNIHCTWLPPYPSLCLVIASLLLWTWPVQSEFQAIFFQFFFDILGAKIIRRSEQQKEPLWSETLLSYTQRTAEEAEAEEAEEEVAARRCCVECGQVAWALSQIVTRRRSGFQLAE